VIQAKLDTHHYDKSDHRHPETYQYHEGKPGIGPAPIHNQTKEAEQTYTLEQGFFFIGISDHTISPKTTKGHTYYQM
jgi:hypothetical protein